VSTKADVLTPQERQVAHDLLVKAMSPEDKAGHSCDMCTPGLEAHAVTALTQDDLDKAVAAAAAPLTAKIADLESQLGQRQADDSVAQAVADAIEPLNKQISELQTALDTELVARKAADDQVTELTDMINTAGAEADKAARRSSRVEAVKDTGVYRHGRRHLRRARRRLEDRQARQAGRQRPAPQWSLRDHRHRRAVGPRRRSLGGDPQVLRFAHPERELRRQQS
jgi:chromosome segregation ATPase